MFNQKLLHSLKIISLIAAIVIIIAIFVLDYFFMGLTIEQIIFHVKYFHTMFGFSGNLITDWRLLLPIGIFSILILSFLIIRYYKETFFSFSLLFVALFGLEYKFDIGEYIYNRLLYSNLYEENYVNPNSVTFTFPQKKKNLIIVYLESFEKNYQNADVFGDNLLRDLEEYKKYSMGRYLQINGSNWTIAGLVTTLCSVPLNVGVFRNGYGSKGFLPNAICLPQILKDAGYHNYWLSTSSVEFAFMDRFFLAHGISAENIYDVKYFEKLYGTSKQRNMFGYNDNLMYPKFKAILKTYENSDEPLFLIVNTISTHMGIELPENCKKHYGDYRDFIYCANKQVADFINWYQKQEIAKDSVLIFIGDHLSMDADLSNKFMGKVDDKREIFSLLLNEDIVFLDKNRSFSGLDILPTFLQAIGAKWGSNRLGLGVSLFSRNEKNLIEEMGLDELNKNLLQYSKIYDELCNIQ